jgi:hypothetical protein
MSSRGPNRDWNKIASNLREHPLEWVLVTEGGFANDSQRIKSGDLPAFRPHGAYEARSKKVADGRYVGTGMEKARFTVELTFDTTDLDADYVLERIAHLVMARDNAAIVSSRRFIDSDKGETA